MIADSYSNPPDGDDVQVSADANALPATVDVIGEVQQCPVVRCMCPGFERLGCVTSMPQVLLSALGLLSLCACAQT